MGDIIRTGKNTVVAINLSRKTAEELNKIPEENIRKLHVFITDTDQVHIPSFRAFAEHAVSSGKTKMIVHCTDKATARQLKRHVRDIPKGKEFHFSWKSSNRAIEFKMQDGGILFVRYVGLSVLCIVWMNQEKTWAKKSLAFSVTTSAES